MKYVRRLNEVSKDDISIAGGKGANLGEMFKAGFPVPDGFCITSISYDLFIKENNFEKIIEEYVNKIYSNEYNSHKLSEELINLLSSGKLPKVIADEVKASYDSLGSEVRIAVRSSATAEDLPEASFAGQQETYLNIIGYEKLFETVKKCFASLWTDRAILYRKKTGFDKVKISLAIVVQSMIEGDISGVLFTVNPTNQNKHQMMINASYGLGEAIVSGIVTPDTLIWNRDLAKFDNKILGSKEISVVYGEKDGIIQKDNSKEKREIICISDKQAKELVQIGEKIEKHYGYPQDIEWAIKNNKIYILQARGITTLKSNSDIGQDVTDKEDKVKCSEVEKIIINNLIEHYPVPLYPLEIEAFNIVAEGKISVFNELGVKMNTQLKMNNNGEIIINTSSPRPSLKVFGMPFKIKNIINYSNNKNCTEECFDRINNKLSNIDRKIRLNIYVNNNDFIKKIKTSELLNLIKEIMGYTKEIVYVRFRYNIFPNVIINKFIHSKIKKIDPDITEYDLLSNLKYKTLDMNKAIDNLVKIVMYDIELKEKILSLKSDSNEELENILEHLSQLYERFGEAYHNILKDFGWKCGNSYEPFSTTSWNEDKRNLITLLQVKMKGGEQKEDKNKYEEICEKVKNKFSKTTSNKLFDKFKHIRYYHVNREESLYMLERCYGLLRIIMTEISVRFPDIFKNKDDILYLFLNEVYKLNSVEDKKNYSDQINVRKRYRKKNIRLWDCCEINHESSSKNILNGISGNSGKVLGRVCIVNEISEFSKLKEGDVLVCRCTDPSWTPLFSLAAAVVSDTGGPLSHSAIVAREYDIPAVLGCGNATKTLMDGQTIVVDGNKGVVQLQK